MGFVFVYVVECLECFFLVFYDCDGLIGNFDCEERFGFLCFFYVVNLLLGVVND